MKLQSLVAGFLSLLFAAQNVWALDNYKEFRRDHWDFELGSSYFYSEANYVNSSSQPLLSGNHFSLMNIDLSSRYMPSRNWSVFGGVTYTASESKDSIATRHNNSFSQAVAGMDFLMYSDAFDLVPELGLLAPFEKVNTSNDTVLNSEGVFQAWARIIAQKDFGSLRAYGWIGLQYRGEGRSYLMPWGAGAQFKISRLRLGAEVFGSQSITDDTDTNNQILRTAYLNSVEAGSFKFYSVNPSVVDTQVYATWLINSKWAVQANGGATVSGNNSAAGYHVGGFLRYSFDMSEGYVTPENWTPTDSAVPAYRSRVNAPTEPDANTQRKVQKFKESTDDGVDQQIFKPAPPPPVRKKKKLNDDQLQKQLDDTEFDVELKSDRHKAH